MNINQSRSTVGKIVIDAMNYWSPTEGIIAEFGFDAIDLESLASGRLFQPDTKLFNARFTTEEMRSLQLSTHGISLHKAFMFA